MKKRPIDRKRDSAGMIEIDDPADPTGITGLIVINGTLHALKENSIYEIKMGDDIDPKRTNPDIPTTYQRVLNLGSKFPLVQRTLLAGQVLFNKNYLPKELNTDKAMTLAFSALKDIAAMLEIASELEANQAEAVQTAHKAKHGFPVPAVGNVAARFKSFIQKADHALQSLLAIMRLFYGREKAKNFEILAEYACHTYGADDPFCNLMNAILPFLKHVRAARNCAEHENPNQRALTKDFHLTEAGTLEAPSVEVVHPKTPAPELPLLAFMTETIEQLGLVFELMVAHACHKHIVQPSPFMIGVLELPDEQRVGQHQARFCYGVYQGDRVVPFS